MAELIPLFPLTAVLFPGLMLPLHIFEERYRLLIGELVALPEGSSRSFGVVAIRAGREVGADGVLALHDVGCSAELRAVEQYEDGRFDILSSGSRRFRLLGVDDSRPYLRGEVDWLDEPSGDAAPVLATSVAAAYGRYRAILANSQAFVDDEDEIPADPTDLSYVVAATMVLDLSDQQELIAAADTSQRLRLELALLRRETAVLRKLPSLPGIDYARQPMSPN